MKRLIILFFLIAAYGHVSAQNLPFVRIYDFHGKKIYKGHILMANDTLVRIKKNSGYIDIPVTAIGTIKTKRSIGHNVLIGTVVGAAFFGGIMAASSDSQEGMIHFTPAELATAGVIIGAPLGAMTGFITTAFKNHKTFRIDGDREKWKAFLNYPTKTNIQQPELQADVNP